MGMPAGALVLAFPGPPCCPAKTTGPVSGTRGEEETMHLPQGWFLEGPEPADLSCSFLHWPGLLYA